MREQATGNLNKESKKALDAVHDHSAWLEMIETEGDDRGYFEPVGERHSAILTDEGPTLLVTFELASNIRANMDNKRPIGWDLVKTNGWSNLTIIAHDESWFRDPAVFGYFDRLVDDGFFEEFDKVVFYGDGMCGYAAATFSIVAPEASIIATQPQATLDTEVANWDHRFPQMRRTSFTDRYGYAPEMIDTAEAAFIFYDPEIVEDSMHAALYNSENTHKISCRHMGENIGQTLWKMGILSFLIDLAGANALDRLSCYEALRVRRNYRPYLANLLDSLEHQKRHKLVKALATNVIAKRDAPRFSRALKRAQNALSKSENKGPIQFRSSRAPVTTAVTVS